MFKKLIFIFSIFFSGLTYNAEKSPAKLQDWKKRYESLSTEDRSHILCKLIQLKKSILAMEELLKEMESFEGTETGDKIGIESFSKTNLEFESGNDDLIKELSKLELNDFSFFLIKSRLAMKKVEKIIKDVLKVPMISELYDILKKLFENKQKIFYGIYNIPPVDILVVNSFLVDFINDLELIKSKL